MPALSHSEESQMTDRICPRCGYVLRYRARCDACGADFHWSLNRFGSVQPTLTAIRTEVTVEDVGGGFIHYGTQIQRMKGWPTTQVEVLCAAEFTGLMQCRASSTSWALVDCPDCLKLHELGTSVAEITKRMTGVK